MCKTSAFFVSCLSFLCVLALFWVSAFFRRFVLNDISLFHSWGPSLWGGSKPPLWLLLPKYRIPLVSCVLLMICRTKPCSSVDGKPRNLAQEANCYGAIVYFFVSTQQTKTPIVFTYLPFILLLMAAAAGRLLLISSHTWGCHLSGTPSVCSPIICKWIVSMWLIYIRRVFGGRGL